MSTEPYANKPYITPQMIGYWQINISKRDILLSKGFRVIYVHVHPLPMRLILNHPNKIIRMKHKVAIHNNQCISWFCYHL